MQDGLIVEEVEHVLDGKRQRTLAVRRTEDCIQQVIDELLHCALCRHTPASQPSLVHPHIRLRQCQQVVALGSRQDDMAPPPS